MHLISWTLLFHEKQTKTLLNPRERPTLHADAEGGRPSGAWQQQGRGLHCQPRALWHASPPFTSHLWLVVLWPLTPIRTISPVYLHSGGRCQTRTCFLEVQELADTQAAALRSPSCWLSMLLNWRMKRQKTFRGQDGWVVVDCFSDSHRRSWNLSSSMFSLEDDWLIFVSSLQTFHWNWCLKFPTHLSACWSVQPLFLLVFLQPPSAVTQLGSLQTCQTGPPCLKRRSRFIRWLLACRIWSWSWYGWYFALTKRPCYKTCK